MEYIIIPTETYEQADKQLAKKLGLDHPRKSIDGTEVIMHIECFERLFGKNGANISLSRRASVSFPIYESGTEEFDTLIQSSAWYIPEEENI